MAGANTNSGGDGSVFDTGTGGMFPNLYAFAALKDDGSVVTWGWSDYGGDSSAVAAELTGDVIKIFSNKSSFAALKSDGSVVTWGEEDSGGNSSYFAAELSDDVVGIYSTRSSFAALKGDGSVVTWGAIQSGSPFHPSGLNDGIVAVYSNPWNFAALKRDGSVITWGRSDWGGDSSSVATELAGDVEEIFSNEYCFAALKSDGSVVTWGLSSYGGDSSSVADDLSGEVVEIFSTLSGFAALKADGSVVTWGLSSYGGDSSSVADDLSGEVVEVFSTTSSFAALKSDGSVVTWGDSDAGGNSSSVAGDLSGEVVEIFSTASSFAALKGDGSVVTWGSSDSGGDSSSVADDLSGNVVEIFSTRWSFAALKGDGSVVTWGDSDAGGDSSSVADDLSGEVVEIFSTAVGFAALKSDGSVVTWGPMYLGGDSSAVADELTSGVVELAGPQSWVDIGETVEAEPTGQSLDPADFKTADEIFAEKGQLAFLAQLAQAAYHLDLEDGHEAETGFYNDGSIFGDAAYSGDTLELSGQKIVFSDLSKDLMLLNAEDIGLESLQESNDIFFPKNGLQNGIYTSENAAALVGRSSDALFLSFRGTNDASKLESLWSNKPGLALTPDTRNWYSRDQHFDLLRELVGAIQAYAADPENEISKIYVTGHSLGAAMVEATMREWRDVGLNVEAITFASPGYNSSMWGGDDRIVNFVIEGDAILTATFASDNDGDMNKIFHDMNIDGESLHSMALYLEYSRFLSGYGFNLEASVKFKGEEYSKFWVNAEVISEDDMLYSIATGDDSIGGSRKADVILGGDGNDTLNGGKGVDYIQGGEDRDTIEGGKGKDFLYGNSGGDTFIVSKGTVSEGEEIWGGKGIDKLLSRGLVSFEDAAIIGGIEALVFEAEGEGAEARASFKSSQFNGGAKQTLGLDLEIKGSSGGDVVDTLYVTMDTDYFDGSGFSFSSWGEVDRTQIEGKKAAEFIVGTDSQDDITGGRGGDDIKGGGGNDTIAGGLGKDVIEGGGGNDTIAGGAGKDVIEGGGGNDTIAGGMQADVFVFSGKSGVDTIEDFSTSLKGEDIDVSGVKAIVDWDDLKENHLSQGGEDSIISWGKNKIILVDIEKSDLDATDFLF